MKYKIIVDSSADFTDQEMQEKKLALVPFKIAVEGTTFVDNYELDLENFIQEVEKSKEPPKSSCPSPDDYLKEMEGDYDHLFIVTISSALSGSYNSANLAKNIYLEDGKAKVHVFDSKSAAGGETLSVLKLHQAIEEGLSFEEIVTKVEEDISKINTLFVLENIENLQKMGRMSLVKFVVANSLKIKLILADNGNGEIEMLSKAIGSKKALKKMITLIDEIKKKPIIDQVVVAHCLDEERALFVKKLIEEAGICSNIKIVPTRGLSSNYACRSGIVLGF
jgi:DegV family protein with EDD domain